MSIDTTLISQLRERTGAGMLDVKKALDEAGGDMEKAIEFLREKGLAKAAKKADRTTGEGLVHAYIHSTGKIGAMVQVLCETDFVARNDSFKELCNDLALHVSALDPEYLTREEVPEAVIAKKKEEFIKEAEGKPADVIDKIVEGKLNKYFAEIVLMEQLFVKDEDMTIKDLITASVLKIGENIQISRFVRFQIG